MKFKRLPLGIYQANCYIIWDDATNKAAVVDPGGDFEELKTYIENNALIVENIILTHGHGDHIGAVEEVKKQYNAEVMIHTNDFEMLNDCKKNYSSKMGSKIVEVEADIKLAHGDIIKIGDTMLQIIHTPGHTKGSICIRCEDKLFTGDTLFAGSVGRTDLEGGSFEDLIKSIKEELLVFSDNTEVYPGHGPSTNIGTEKKFNPFLK